MTGMDLLEDRIKSMAIQSVAIGVGTALLGVALLAGSALMFKDGENGAFMGVMGLGSFGIAWALSTNGRQAWPPRESDIYKAYASEPDKVAWVYGKIGKTNGVVIVLTDGSETMLWANAEQSAALIELTRQRAPGAVVGYGAAQRQAYLDKMKARKAASAG